MNVRITRGRREILQLMLYAFMVVLGVLFIINNAFLLMLAFYAVGGIIIILAFGFLLAFIKRQRQFDNQAQYRTLLSNNPVLSIFLIVLTFCSGLTVILNAGMGIDFYQGVLSSLFFFRGVHRFVVAYFNHKIGNNKRSVELAILASIGLILAAFFSFYTGKEMVVAIVSGVAVIMEAAYGIFILLTRDRLRKRAFGFKGTSTFNQRAGFNGYTDYSGGGINDYPKETNTETIITDYEIVEDEKEDK